MFAVKVQEPANKGFLERSRTIGSRDRGMEAKARVLG